MNRIQSKNHRIGTYEIKKISLSYFDDKNVSKTMDMRDQLLDIIANYKKEVILITTEKRFFVKHIVLIFFQSKQLFCQAYCFNFQTNQDSFFCQCIKILSDFWLGIVNLKNARHLKKISEDLMSIACFPKRWCNFCMSEDEKKEIEPIFTETFCHTKT